jgi:hypothetical protein
MIAQFLLALLEQNPSVPLDDLQARLDSVYGVVFHTTTISRALNAIGIRNKRVRRPAPPCHLQTHSVSNSYPNQLPKGAKKLELTSASRQEHIPRNSLSGWTRVAWICALHIG